MKSIVLLGGGPEQADAIKISKELGCNTIVLDSNLLAVERKFADKFIQCDIKNSSEVFRNIENLGVNGLMVHAIELSNVVAEVSDQISVEEFKPKFNRGYSIRYIIPNPGKIVSITGVDKAQKIEGVIDIILSDDLQEGKVISPMKNNTNRKGIVITVGKNRNEAVERAERARDLINVKTSLN